MKKILFLAVVALSSVFATAQEIQTDSLNKLTKQDYLELSKRQKKTARTFLVTGLVTASLGGIILTAATVKDVGCLFQNCGASQGVYTTASVFLIAGGILSVISIPIYIKASDNKRKGLSLTAGHQVIPQMKVQSIGNNFVPSLSLSITF
ncbi:hypothetical protein [Lacibacter sediminis]|uniref:Uncharacterized protein n=1 Tax=Lacibacter sediminis TaxID=2760713 RepID=A0A7G5XGU3_9BACT|nr:hypothetical protein [Lacibacter sediminis]QNA44696.1 hypothetical protein H4075_00425 [Lacibacter sediminis]